MQGYDLDLALKIKTLAKIPVTFLGGAGSLQHIEKLIENFGVVGAAAGSLFVFKGKYRAVLINYPAFLEKLEICSRALKVYNSNKGVSCV
jgi:cyclase